MNEWKVVFFANAPAWQFPNLVQWEAGPDGTRVPWISCTTVHAPGNGFVELTLVPQGTSPLLTLLVRQDHVLLAIRLKPNLQTGFAMPRQESCTEPTEPSEQTSPAGEPPSTPGDGGTTDTA